jgi:hypothetical protein
MSHIYASLDARGDEQQGMTRVVTHMRDDEVERSGSLKAESKHLRERVRNCHLRVNKYTTYTKGVWSMHTVSVGHRYGSLSVTTVSKRYA